MEYLQPLYDWLRDELNFRVLIAILGIPGAILGIYRFILWLRNRDIDRRVEDINETLKRIQDTLDGSGVSERPLLSPTEAIAPKPTQARESAVDRDRRVGEAFALLRQGKRFDFDWADYVLVAYIKRREALKNVGKEINPENMFGTPEKPTHFRKIFKDLLIASMGEQEVILRCHLTPGHLGLKGLEAALTVGALVHKRDERFWHLKYETIPKFKTEGISRD